MVSTRIAFIRDIYNERAPTYDTGAVSKFHHDQASDYQSYAAPQPGQKILDLACGTEIARNKAAAGNVANVQFIEADVTRVGDLEVVKEVVESGGFDTITCAAAAVLIEDLATAVKHWAGLLKTNGRIIFDTPSAFSFIQGMLLEKVGKEIGIPVPFSRTSMASLDEVKKLLSDAELDASKSFVLRDYAEKEEWIETAEGKAVEEWEKMVSEKKFFQRNYLDRVAAEGLTEKAKRVFVKELGRLGGSEGRVKQESRFNVGVGKKQ